MIDCKCKHCGFVILVVLLFYQNIAVFCGGPTWQHWLKQWCELFVQTKGSDFGRCCNSGTFI